MAELTQNKQDSVQFVEFLVSGDCYALPITCVQEIVKVGQIVHIPKTSEFIRGVINLRGKIIPVIDLKKRFGFVESELNPKSRIIVSEINNRIVGLVVDDVYEVIAPDLTKISKGEIKTKIVQTFVRGVVRHKDKILIILGPDQIMAEEELSNIYQLIEG